MTAVKSTVKYYVYIFMLFMFIIYGVIFVLGIYFITKHDKLTNLVMPFQPYNAIFLREKRVPMIQNRINLFFYINMRYVDAVCSISADRRRHEIL